MRIGHGYDVHKFGGEGPIRIGGVPIAHSKGLIAHSDGDVLIHALCDAIIGALGVGDIGHWFPDTDSQYKNIDSGELLKNVATKMFQQGYKLSNADVTIIAEQPKMAPHIASMRQRLADLCQVAVNDINIKATTTEGLGFAGREEGIAAHAVVLLKKCY